MELIDKQYTERPYYGALRMQAYISSLGYKVNIKRIRRLMRLMGLDVIYSKPNLSKPDQAHKKYPYLLRNVEVTKCDQVWSMDITYIPMKKGFMYLTAIIDWHSRYILSWKLSNTLDGAFCRECLTGALSCNKPEIFNTDQGVQFTSERFQEILTSAKDIKVSMDGKGRALDNVFIERFWRTLKYEYVYLYSQSSVKELYDGIKEYIDFYNNRRQHQSLGYKTPYEIYSERESLDYEEEYLKQVS
jgi:putative transposase